MALRIYIFLFFVVLSSSLTAQKRLSQTYSASGITEVYINSNDIFHIKVTAVQTDEITVHTIIDGETFSSTLLHTNIDNGILNITTGKTPDYVPFNDKLSAHKVIAIELEITIPVEIGFSLYSTLSSVETYGRLGQVRVDLGRGNFVGREFRFRESAHINTIEGDIDIDLHEAHITAQSRNGIVVIATDFRSGSPLVIESLHGNITIRKSR